MTRQLGEKTDKLTNTVSRDFIAIVVPSSQALPVISRYNRKAFSGVLNRTRKKLSLYSLLASSVRIIIANIGRNSRYSTPTPTA